MDMSASRLKHKDAGVTRRDALRGAAALGASLMFGNFFTPNLAKAENGSAVKLGTVSIAEMKKWNEETKKYRVLGEARSKRGFATLVKVQFNGEVFLASGSVDYKNNSHTVMTFKFKDKTGKVREYGQVDLTKLAHLYEKQTGKKFTSFEIVVEKGNDPKAGDYIQFWAVPNGEIKPGVPVLAAYGYAKGNVGTSDKPDLLAYAK